MNLMKPLTKRAVRLYAATAVLAGATLMPTLTPSLISIAQADGTTQTLVGQGAYLCQNMQDTPGSTLSYYTVTMRMQLNAPRSVQPGDKVTLNGTLTLQFDEQTYQDASTLKVKSFDGYSSTLSVVTTTNGQSTVAPASRWQTAPFPLSDPVTVSAPISFPPFTVPADAKGAVGLTLPRNGTADNTSSATPPKVAWTAVANAYTQAGTKLPQNLSCYLERGNPSTIGSIPVAAAAQAASGSTTKSTKPGTAPAASTAPAGTAVAPVAPVAAAPASGSDAAAAPVAGAPAAPVAAAPQPVVVPTAPAAQPTGSGVYVPTNLLVIGGFLVCAGALGYAGLANYRLRMIRKAMDG